MMKIQLV